MPSKGTEIKPDGSGHIVFDRREHKQAKLEKKHHCNLPNAAKYRTGTLFKCECGRLHWRGTVDMWWWQPFPMSIFWKIIRRYHSPKKVGVKLDVPKNEAKELSA